MTPTLYSAISWSVLFLFICSRFRICDRFRGCTTTAAYLRVGNCGNSRCLISRDICLTVSTARMLAKITSPPNNSVVTGFLSSLRGTIAPLFVQITAIVRSESDNQWWVQEITSPTSASGKRRGDWTVRAYFGDEENGKGNQFEVIALASNKPVLERLLLGIYLTQGMTIDTVPQWCQSEVLLLRRED